MAAARRARRQVDSSDYLPEDDREEFEEDERPRRKRRVRDDGEDDDEEDEDEPPRRKRRSRDDDDDEEDERPRKRRARDDDDDDEDERPRKKKRSRAATNMGGWGQYKRAKSKTSSFADKWKPGPDETLVKFLDDEPFASYALHWFDEARGKKGWICLDSLPEPDKCPGCATGDRPSGKVLFRVVVFSDDGLPDVRVLEAGTRLGDQLEGVASGKSGPLSRHYWSIQSTGGKGGRYAVNLNVVRERDVEDDWDFPPPDEDELDDLAEREFTIEDVEKIPSRREFKEFVDSLDD